MLTALVVSLLTQAPSCVTVNGTRTCGYSCVDNGQVAACAQTALGLCSKGGGAVACWDPPAWLVAAYDGKPPAASCLSDSGAIACGFDCKKQSGKVACAATPRGVCTTQAFEVTCFDPPPEVYGVFGKDAPAPTCQVREGKTACGYNCLAARGKPACSATPFGTCAEFGGQATCIDPPKAVICAKGKATPKPMCLNVSGTAVCGYKCAQGGADASCARTPDGSCDTQGPGKPTCFDPQVGGGTAVCLQAAAASRSP